VIRTLVTVVRGVAIWLDSPAAKWPTLAALVLLTIVVLALDARARRGSAR
jgi:hypothetical protein